VLLSFLAQGKFSSHPNLPQRGKGLAIYFLPLRGKVRMGVEFHLGGVRMGESEKSHPL